MPPRLYGNKRDIAEPAVVDALRGAGCSVFLMHEPTDLLVGFRGRNYLLEVKTGRRGTLTTDQKEFIASWRGAVIVVRSDEEALALVKQWRTTP